MGHCKVIKFACEQNMYSFLITDPKSWIKANKENPPTKFKFHGI